MFKRVAKRLRKQEEEEELGLDAAAKEILGLHDTDSDESSSSSDDSDESEDEEDLQEGAVEEEGSTVEEEGDVDDSDAETENSDLDEPPVTIAEALKDPLYIVSLEPAVKACVACPGKILKNPTMEEVHRSSNAHVRRYKRFREIAGETSLDADVLDIVEQLGESQETKENKPKGISKRAQKRQQKLAAVKAKRQKEKEMKAKGIERKKAKAAAKAEDETESPSPAAKPHKKRKESHPGNDHAEKLFTKTALGAPKISRAPSTNGDLDTISLKHDRLKKKGDIDTELDKKIGVKRKRQRKDV